jgi:hypothetical protein
VLGIRIAFLSRVNRRIAIGSVELPVVAKHLRELREGRVQPKTQRHAFGVVVQPISSDLRAAFDAVVQIPKELSGIAAKTLPDVKRRSKSGFRINRHEHPLASKFLRIAFSDALLFLANHVQISSISKYLGLSPRILTSLRLVLRSPATMSKRMIVFRLSPVSRSVLRIEQPSRRHCSAFAAASVLVRMVPRGDLG